MSQICCCGNSDLEEYSEFYYKCSKCGTLISKFDFSENIYDVENENSDLYGKHYWQKEMLKMAGVVSTDELIDLYLRERCAYWCKYVVKYVKPGSKVAETGCGLGQMSYLLSSLGYKTTGFELSKEICQYVEETLRIKMHHGELKESKENFDAILGFDLFEHILKPHEFLKDCKKKLGNSGILCFQTPCYDPSLSYEEMMNLKPRFREQMKEEQHVFLYSEKSIQKLLKECGFPYVIFEPAYFGNDYDMFLFASGSPIKECSFQEWNERLNGVPGGRVVKAVILLEEQVRKTSEMLAVSQKDSEERLNNINILTEQLNKYRKDSEDRLQNVNILTEQLKECQADSGERLKNLNTLTEQLHECQKESKERLENVEVLTEQLELCRADSAVRLRNVNILTEQLVACQNESAERLKNIELLTEQLGVCQADSEERLRNINILTEQLKKCQADSEERLNNVNLLTQQLLECQKDSAVRLENMGILDELLKAKQEQCEKQEQMIQELIKKNQELEQR